MEFYEERTKVNEYTMAVLWDTPNMLARTRLMRIFNFRAQEVTELSERWHASAPHFTEKSTKFSELESLDEVQFIRDLLVQSGGKPPEIPDREPRRLDKRDSGTPSLG